MSTYKVILGLAILFLKPPKSDRLEHPESFARYYPPWPIDVGRDGENGACFGSQAWVVNLVQ
jgi:hypothetical protein